MAFLLLFPLPEGCSVCVCVCGRVVIPAGRWQSLISECQQWLLKGEHAWGTATPEGQECALTPVHLLPLS